MRLSRFIFLGLFVCSTSVFAEKFYDVQCNDHNGDSIFSSLIKTSDENIIPDSRGGFSLSGVSQFGQLIFAPVTNLEQFGLDISSCSGRRNARAFVYETKELQTELYCASGKIQEGPSNLEIFANDQLRGRADCVFLLDSERFGAYRNRHLNNK